MTGVSEACSFFTALALITTKNITAVDVVTVSQHAECTFTGNLSSYHSPILKKNILCWSRPLQMQQPFNLASKSNFETHTVRAACRDESSLWYPHRWGRKAPRKQAAHWIGRVCVLRPPAPMAQPIILRSEMWTRHQNEQISLCSETHQWCLAALRHIQAWWRYRMLSPIIIDIMLLLDTHTKGMPLLSLGIKSTAQYQTWTIIHIRMVDGIKDWVNVHPLSFPVGYWIPRQMLRSCDSWHLFLFLVTVPKSLSFHGEQTFRRTSKKSTRKEWHWWQAKFVFLCWAMCRVSHLSVNND